MRPTSAALSQLLEINVMLNAISEFWDLRVYVANDNKRRWNEIWLERLKMDMMPKCEEK